MPAYGYFEGYPKKAAKALLAIGIDGWCRIHAIDGECFLQFGYKTPQDVD